MSNAPEVIRDSVHNLIPLTDKEGATANLVDILLTLILWQARMPRDRLLCPP